MQHTAERPTDPLTLRLYVPAADGAGVSTLYEDDGISTNYQRGAFALRRSGYRWQASGRLVITLEKPDGAYQPERRQLQLEVHLPFAASRRRDTFAERSPLAGRLGGEGWTLLTTRSEAVLTRAFDETGERREV